uniref:Leucokinin-8 n=1 Tax=Rhyparobia maderae TaxID=36963 RepID=LCK8_RHYMA|nr:RecName: Full=Leucokinin-8; AltName: Full=Leucokinin VIII; Short=L-VIII [Rhyparobia maderae]prf//1402210B leucokinin VIII [Rhyparobia maderae]
GADFYSWG